MEARWGAVLARTELPGDAFVYGVRTTGIVCRPGCASRRPRVENVAFFDRLEDAVQAGFRPCLRCHGGRRASAGVVALVKACRLLATDGEAPSSRAVAEAVGMTPASLVRAFRARLGITPRQYRGRMLAGRARAALGRTQSVTEALYAAGYSASSRFYAGVGKEFGMTPRQVRRGGQGQAVRAAARLTSLGPVGVVWTAGGVCDVFFVDQLTEVQAQVSERWPAATREVAPLPKWLERAVAAAERPTAVDVPRDIQRTAFLERVWRAVRC